MQMFSMEPDMSADESGAQAKSCTSSVWPLVHQMQQTCQCSRARIDGLASSAKALSTACKVLTSSFLT